MSDQETPSADEKPELFTTYLEFILPDHPTVDVYEKYNAGRDEYITAARSADRTPLTNVADFVGVGKLVKAGYVHMRGTAVAKMQEYFDAKDVTTVPMEIVSMVQYVAVGPLEAKTRPLSVSVPSLKTLLGITPSSAGETIPNSTQTNRPPDTTSPESAQ